MAELDQYHNGPEDAEYDPDWRPLVLDHVDVIDGTENNVSNHQLREHLLSLIRQGRYLEVDWASVDQNCDEHSQLQSYVPHNGS